MTSALFALVEEKGKTECSGHQSEEQKAEEELQFLASKARHALFLSPTQPSRLAHCGVLVSPGWEEREP